jgi:hypothetical protein
MARPQRLNPDAVLQRVPNVVDIGTGVLAMATARAGRHVSPRSKQRAIVDHAGPPFNAVNGPSEPESTEVIWRG